MKLPIRITPCPIIESNLEIRFSSAYPEDAVIGIIYNVLQSQYKNCKLEQLPILQIPAEIRKHDVNLQNKPTHIIHTEHFIVHIGPTVVVLGVPGSYPGWDKFLEVIKEFIDNLKTIKILNSINYIGLRFLNFFQLNVLEHINLKIDLCGDVSSNNGTIFRTELDKGGYVNVLQITNSVHVKNNAIDADGSLIDITTVLKHNMLSLDKCIENINLAHDGEKQLFYSLLKEDFLKTLNPQYRL